jgi:isopentenyldiphosphate isomerase
MKIILNEASARRAAEKQYIQQQKKNKDTEKFIERFRYKATKQDKYRE